MNTRAFYRSLRTATKVAAERAAEVGAGRAIAYAATPDAGGQHAGGWYNQTFNMESSYRYSVTRMGTDVLVVLANDAHYAVYVERLGLWVVAGLAVVTAEEVRAAWPEVFASARS